ncbi:MAG: HlyD family type I secretion periplasmic adaptor subunit, partial [Phyllobacteriaceae bacterium]|nr:HlyD family type I secretion periplasmic adaptor subunit [Phyllobacteriaceae bacterium]
MDTKRSTRRTLFAGHLSLLAMVGVLGGWAYSAKLNGAVIAPATIVVESYSKKVQHQQGGIVARILVKDGDRVERGQDLIVLDTTDTKAELTILEGLLDELKIRRARLEAQRDGMAQLVVPESIIARAKDSNLAAIIAGQQKLLSSSSESPKGKVDQLIQQVDQLSEQIKGIDAQIVSQSTQSRLIAEELNSLKVLQDKGLVPNSRVLSVQREAARLKGAKAELSSSRASSEARIGEVKLRIIQIEEDRRTEALTDLRDTESKIAELEEKRVSASARLARTSIKAPITGSIYQLAIHTEGGVIGPGETLMLIVPEGDDLVLQAQVAPNDIDQVIAGQSAQVRFPGFNARVTPEVSAVVTQVGADVTRVDVNSPPFYAVRLTISAAELKLIGDNKLKPGMAAEAFIQTEASSPLKYLMKPLMDQISHA